MPRLPTIRVIGSHAISTRSDLPLVLMPLSVCVSVISRSPSAPRRLVAGIELLAGVPPLRLLVELAFGDLPQPPDHRPVRAAGQRRHLRARRLVHERHELVREARHGAADADPADVRAAADAVDPAALRHVALDDRTPAAQLDQALRGAVLGGELALLVVAAAVT